MEKCRALWNRGGNEGLLSFSMMWQNSKDGIVLQRVVCEDNGSLSDSSKSLGLFRAEYHHEL